MVVALLNFTAAPTLLVSLNVCIIGMLCYNISYITYIALPPPSYVCICNVTYCIAKKEKTNQEEFKSIMSRTKLHLSHVFFP